MLTWDNILFYTVFLGQIFIISYYFPRKILARMKKVLETYPPAEYPKLYPQSIEYYKIGHSVYKTVNQIIVAIGFLIIALMLFVVDHSTFADDGFISEFWPAAYGMLQFLPSIFLEFSEYGQTKLMRKLNTTATRTANLRRRELSDYVSMKLVVIAVLLYLTTVFFDLSMHQFQIDWGRDYSQRLIVLTITNLVLATFGAWHLYGQKRNPHQDLKDRASHIAANLRSLLYVSSAMSIFFITQSADDVFDLDYLDATIMSIYFQVIVIVTLGHLLRSVRLSEVDFDVYKADGATLT